MLTPEGRVVAVSGGGPERQRRRREGDSCSPQGVLKPPQQWMRQHTLEANARSSNSRHGRATTRYPLVLAQNRVRVAHHIALAQQFGIALGHTAGVEVRQSPSREVHPPVHALPPHPSQCKYCYTARSSSMSMLASPLTVRTLALSVRCNTLAMLLRVDALSTAVKSPSSRARGDAGASTVWPVAASALSELTRNSDK